MGTTTRPTTIRKTRTKKRSYRDHDDITTTTSPIKKKRGRPRKKKSKNNIDYDNDTPPQGILPSLWYTREAGLHIFVIEKILGWKTRPIYNYDVNVQTLNLTINQI